MRIHILRSARNDLEDGYDFYEDCEEDIGEYFLRSLETDIRSLETTGGTHQIVRGYFRKYASRFPHAIFYKVELDEVRIHAVIDTRRDPAWIEGQLETRSEMN